MTHVMRTIKHSCPMNHLHLLPPKWTLPARVCLEFYATDTQGGGAQCTLGCPRGAYFHRSHS